MFQQKSIIRSKVINFFVSWKSCSSKVSKYGLLLAYEWYCKKQFLSFWRQRATSRNEHVTNVLFSFPDWDHTVHRCLVSKKIGNCDGGIQAGLLALVRLNRGWIGQDIFLVTKEVISFNAMHILNSFRVRSLFSNFLYTIKELRRATSNTWKNKRK